MQRMKKPTLYSLLFVLIVLSGFATVSGQTMSPTTAPPLLVKPVEAQDSDTLKALEIALIRLKAANDTILLLNDRLVAKDEIIKAKDGTISILEKQKELAEKIDKNGERIATIDQFRVEACQQQLEKSDREIARLRHPGFFRSVFDPRTLTGAMIGFGIGKVAK